MTTRTHARRRNAEHWTALLGVDQRLRTIVPTALLVVCIAAIPLHTVWGRVLIASCASIVAVLGTVSWAGFTAPQWITRRLQVAMRRHRPLQTVVADEQEADEPEPTAAPALQGEGTEAAATAGDAEADSDTPAAPVQRKVILPITAVSSGDEVGVDWSNGQLVAALDLHGHPLVPHQLYQRQITSTATVPIAELEARLDSLTGGEAPATVDLVFETRRLTPTRYSVTYDTQLSGQPVAGYRRTLLICRFDPSANPAYYAARQSLPDAVAATMARIRRTVAVADCPATALTGPQLKALHHSTSPAARAIPDRSAGDEAAALERWTHIAPDSSRGSYDTVYAIDSGALTDDRIRDLWAIRADAVVVTLRRDRRGWLGFVRVRTATAPSGPPLPFVRALPGQQAAAVAIGRPVADQEPVRTIFEPVESLAGLTLPAGGDGQVLGADELGRQLLLPLVPGADKIIRARVDLMYAQQQILRAEATGANITIVTNTPQRWAPLASPRIAVVPDDAELPIGPGELHVYDDGMAPPQNAGATTLSLIAPGGPDPAGPITLDQAGDTITVTAGGSSYRIRRRIDPAELAYLPAAQTISRGRP